VRLRRGARALWVAGALSACGEVPPAALPLRTELGKNVQRLRPTESAPGMPWRYDTGEVVESVVSPDGGFRVHFTRAGRNAVPAQDVNDSGVPDLVEQVGQAYDQVAAFYAGTLNFRAPLGDGQLGGDGRFDVYLLDFGGAADGTFQVDSCPLSNPDTCSGHVLQENDFAGYGYASALQGTRVLGSHEYFHAIQSAYDKTQGVVLEEGTAVWGSTRFDPSLGELEGFAGGYLSRPERALDSPPPGPVPDFAYGSAVFFEFLDEKFGPDVIRQLWERCEQAPEKSWLARLDELLQQQYASSFAQAFAEFARWNLYTGGAADSRQAWADARRFPVVANTQVSVPYQSPSPPYLFYASARYFRAAASGRALMTAAVVDNPGTAQDDTEGLTLHLVTRRSGKNAAAVTPASVSAGLEAVDTSGTAELWVAVANGAVSGTSRRPHLCIGTPEEVATCREALSPAPPDAGVEVPDAGTGSPDGQDGGGGGGAPAPSGCGCSGSGPTSAAGWLGVLGLWRLRRPRRER
jgi:uncharacterized protein (TIGR03382 family)